MRPRAPEERWVYPLSCELEDFDEVRDEMPCVPVDDMKAIHIELDSGQAAAKAALAILGIRNMTIEDVKLSHL